jgi:hypothetical protein
MLRVQLSTTILLPDHMVHFTGHNITQRVIIIIIIITVMLMERIIIRRIIVMHIYPFLKTARRAPCLNRLFIKQNRSTTHGGARHPQILKKKRAFAQTPPLLLATRSGR